MLARSLCLACLVGLVRVALADGGVRPLSSEDLAITTPPAAGSAAHEAIGGSIRHSFEKIATGNPEEVKDTRRDLAGLLRKPEATPVFHRFFLEIAKPEVERLVATGDAYRATNALMVIRWVRTPEAMELVRLQCDPAKQPDVRMRAAAANLLPAMIEGGCVPANQVDVVSRRVSELVPVESDWVVASQEIAAIAALASMAAEAKMASQASTIRGELVQAVASLVGRVAAGEDRSLAPACYRGLIAIRDNVVAMNPGEKAQLAATLLPMLQKVDSVPENPARASESAEIEWRGARKVAATLKALMAASAGR